MHINSGAINQNVDDKRLMKSTKGVISWKNVTTRKAKGTTTNEIETFIQERIEAIAGLTNLIHQSGNMSPKTSASKLNLDSHIGNAIMATVKESMSFETVPLEKQEVETKASGILRTRTIVGVPLITTLIRKNVGDRTEKAAHTVPSTATGKRGGTRMTVPECGGIRMQVSPIGTKAALASKERVFVAEAP